MERDDIVLDKTVISFREDAPLSAELTVTIAGRFVSDLRHRQGARILEDEAVFIFTDGGKGRVLADGNEQSANPGEAFLLFPGTLHAYQTAESEWHIYWFHCKGPLVGELMRRTERSWLPPTRLDTEINVIDHMARIIREMQDQLHSYASLVEAHAKILLIALTRAHERLGTDQHLRGLRLAQNVAAYIREHVNQDIGVAELARTFHVSGRHLTRLFQTHLGETPKQYIIRAKLAEAKRLLYLTDLTVAEVAARLGMQDPHYFSRLFHRKTGETPTDFRLAGNRPPHVPANPDV